MVARGHQHVEEHALLAEHIVAYRLDGPLFFAAAHRLLLQLPEITDVDGMFRLSEVPAGTIQLRIFYTGFPPQFESVNVVAGEPGVLQVLLDVSDEAHSNPGRLAPPSTCQCRWKTVCPPPGPTSPRTGTSSLRGAS